MIIEFTVALLYAFCCTCAGSAVLAWLGLAGARKAPRPVVAGVGTAFILGQGLVSQCLILLGLVTDFALTPVIVVLFVAVLAGARAAMHSLHAATGEIARSFLDWRAAGLIWKAAGITGLAYLGGLLLAALVLPPIGDAEAFYLVYAKFIAGGQRFVPLAGNYEPFSSIGLVGELHFAALFLFAGQFAAKAYAWLVAAAACAMLLHIGRACGLGLRGGLVTALLVLTSTTFTAYVTDGKVDLFAAALGLAAYFWALQPAEDAKARSSAAVAGLLTGLACIAKFSYVPTLIPGVLLLLAWREANGATLKSLARWLVPFCAAAAIVAMPHLIKNAIFFGEPLAPFVTAYKEREWLSQVWFSAEATRWIVMTYPLALAFGQYPMQGGTISFLALVLLPLAFYLPRPARWRDSALAKVTLAGLIGVAIWLVFRPSVLAPRYLLAPLLLLLLLPSRALEHLSLRQPAPNTLKAVRTVIAGSFAIALYVLVQPLKQVAAEMVKLKGAPIPHCYRASPYCEALQQVNDRTPQGARVFLGLYYTYWLRPDLLICRNTYAEIRSEKALADAASRWEALFENGFEMVIIDKASHKEELARLDPASAPAWLDVRSVSTKGPVVIYSLATRDPARKAALVCRARSPVAWEVVPAVRLNPASGSGGSLSMFNR